MSFAQRTQPKSIGTGLLAKYPLVNGTRGAVQLYATPDFTTLTCQTPTGNCTTPFITPQQTM